MNNVIIVLLAIGLALFTISDVLADKPEFPSDDPPPPEFPPGPPPPPEDPPFIPPGKGGDPPGKLL